MSFDRHLLRCAVHYLELWCYKFKQQTTKLVNLEEIQSFFKISLRHDYLQKEKGCSSTTAFEFFILAQSWQPEFCYGNYDKYPGCTNPKDFWKENLTVHGLWPQNLDGSYPCSCEGDPFYPGVIATVGMTWMVNDWPNVKDAQPNDPAYEDFWQHEWDKHGVCSQLDQATYFESTLLKLEEFGTPELVANRKGSSVSHKELMEAYGGKDMAVFKCNSGKYLSQVYLCVSKDSDSNPGIRRQCPPSVIYEGTCGETIYIQDFVQISDDQGHKHLRNQVHEGSKVKLRGHSRTTGLLEEENFSQEASSLMQEHTRSSDEEQFYLLAMIWQPEECFGHEKEYPGCQSPEAAWAQQLTIHGLWPNYYNGGWPQFCTSEKLDLAIIQSIGLNTMELNWPNVMEDASSPQYKDFWEHEWEKHGTCTGLSQELYFTKTLALHQQFGDSTFIAENSGQSVSKSDLLDSFGGDGMAILLCEDNGFLSQVYICLQEEKEEDTSATIEGDVTMQKIQCPSSVIGEDTCSSTIYIPKFMHQSHSD
eukprot:CAMPEP_0117893682 /NCGR_PEP_ID=MMETSP0950-20121206/25476_1 /TAXON_ID=44440 /ORGANISM="Chattonella subsalsa, Strain CCMP2191" /LENGTH=532 /DNA_ID=CAMNT_0005753997 /DNA_START=67 /DNA_END=1665 /DNA_ORIENTATION=+